VSRFNVEIPIIITHSCRLFCATNFGQISATMPTGAALRFFQALEMMQAAALSNIRQVFFMYPKRLSCSLAIYFRYKSVWGWGIGGYLMSICSDCGCKVTFMVRKDWEGNQSSWRLISLQLATILNQCPNAPHHCWLYFVCLSVIL